MPVENGSYSGSSVKNVEMHPGASANLLRYFSGAICNASHISA